MKKLSLKFGEGGPKAFLLQHIEKIVLGIAVLLVAAFFVMGYSVESVPDEQSPKSLRTLADSAKATIDRDSWDELVVKRQPPFDHLARADTSRLETSSSDYPITMSWDPQKFRRQTKRADPELYPPTNIEVAVARVGMVLRKERADDSNPLDGAPLATVKSDPKTTTAKNDKRTSGGPSSMTMPGGMSSAMSSSAMLAGMGAPGGPGGSGAASGRGGGKKNDDDDEVLGGGMMPGMMGLSGGGGASGQSKMVPAKYQAELVGYRPSNMQLGVVKSVNVVAVKAPVPWKKQFAEYERKLAESVSYNPQRDTPTYLYFEAERAEVPADPSQPLDWQTVMHTDYQAEQMKSWAGVTPEVVDQNFIAPSLTTPIPPVVMYNPDVLGMHSMVTKSRTRPVMMEASEETTETAPASTGIGAAGAGLGTGAGGATLGGGMMMPGGGMSSGSMMSGMMAPGMAGAPGGAGMSSGMMAGGMSSGMMSGGMSSGMMSGGMSSGMMSGGMSSGMMAGGMMGGGSSMAAVAPPVDYKLVRFFDTTAEPGKTYVYRVRVWLNDPNFIDPNPRSGSSSESTGGAAMMAGGTAGGLGGGAMGGDGMSRPLSHSALQDDVIARLRDQQAKDAADPRGSAEAPFTTKWRITEWSEPSPQVKVPLRAQEMLAGEVTGESAMQFPQGDDKLIVWGEPTGKFLPVVWDDDLAARVPLEQTVYRGSVLNDKATVEIAHPVDLAFREMKDYEFESDAVVVDIRGGAKLPKNPKRRDDEELRSPGEFLIVTWDGQLEATDELEDLDAYRRTLFVDDAPQATGGGAMPGMPGMMMPGMPGTNDEKGKKGRGRQSGMSSGMPAGMGGTMPGGMSMPPGMGGGGRGRGR